jgi:predicted O-methyltransferase YrrM
MNFDGKVNKVIEQYHQRMKEEEFFWDNLSMEEMMKREDEWLLAVGFNTGVFINTLAKSAESKTILELGTSYGYSTIFLAEAARENGGRVISLEIHSQKVDYAKQKIKEAGLSDFVEFRLGDALEILNGSKENYDFVLLDIWKRYYLPTFELFYPKLNKGAWVIADNMLHPPEFKPEATAYRNRIRETDSFDSVLLPMGSGIETSYLR